MGFVGNLSFLQQRKNFTNRSQLIKL